MNEMHHSQDGEAQAAAEAAPAHAAAQLPPLPRGAERRAIARVRPVGRPSAPRRPSRARRGWRLRMRAARVWGAAADVDHMPDAESVVGGQAVERASASGDGGLSPGVRRALAQIFAEPGRDAALGGAGAEGAQAGRPLRRVAEERAPYGEAPHTGGPGSRP